MNENDAVPELWGRGADHYERIAKAYATGRYDRWLRQDQSREQAVNECRQRAERFRRIAAAMRGKP